VSVSARVSWRETPSCGREGSEVVAFRMFLHEHLGVRRLLAGAKAVELWHLAVSWREAPLQSCSREDGGVVAFACASA
jgi:hypothetical protein